MMKSSKIEAMFHWRYRTWLMLAKEFWNIVNQLINQLVDTTNIFLGQTLCYAKIKPATIVAKEMLKGVCWL